MNTFRGEPLCSGEGWLVIVRGFDGIWRPWQESVARTRREAIDRYDGMLPVYERARRRGEAKAVRCVIEPAVFGEDR